MSSFGSTTRFRSACLTMLFTIISAIGLPQFGAPAGALTATVRYPLGLCQANLIQASTSPGEASRGTIALSLGGAPASADECVDDAYTNSGVAITTGGSASSSITAIALTSCYSIGDWLSAVGGGIGQCGRGFVANVSVFGDAYGGLPGSLLSFSLLGDASGSWLAVAPFGSASGQAAVGCTAAYSPADVSWRWCAIWESALTDAQKQAVYETLQALATLGLVETQSVLNFYNGFMQTTNNVVQPVVAPIPTTRPNPICVPYEGNVPIGMVSYTVSGGLLCYDPDPVPPSCHEDYQYDSGFAVMTIEFSTPITLTASFQETAAGLAARGGSYDEYIQYAHDIWHNGNYVQGGYHTHEVLYPYHVSADYQMPQAGDIYRVDFYLGTGFPRPHEGHVFCAVYPGRVE